MFIYWEAYRISAARLRNRGVWVRMRNGSRMFKIWKCIGKVTDICRWWNGNNDWRMGMSLTYILGMYCTRLHCLTVRKWLMSLTSAQCNLTLPVPNHRSMLWTYAETLAAWLVGMLDLEALDDNGRTTYFACVSWSEFYEDHVRLQIGLGLYLSFEHASHWIFRSSKIQDFLGKIDSL